MRRTQLQQLRWMLNASIKIQNCISQLMFNEINEVGYDLDNFEIIELKEQVNSLAEWFDEFQKYRERD